MKPKMKGGIISRGKNSWALVLDLGYVAQPDGTRKRKQKWVTFKGTKEQAKTKRNELVHALNHGEFVEPTKLTLGEWLTEWLEKSVKPTKRIQTYGTYKSVVTANLTPALGHIRLQALKPVDVQQYYASHATLAPATVGLHHAVLSASLRSAVKNGLVTRNVASLADGKPRIEHAADD